MKNLHKAALPVDERELLKLAVRDPGLVVAGPAMDTALALERRGYALVEAASVEDPETDAIVWGLRVDPTPEGCRVNAGSVRPCRF